MIQGFVQKLFPVIIQTAISYKYRSSIEIRSGNLDHGKLHFVL